mgnify:CR=1 FL=1
MLLHNNKYTLKISIPGQESTLEFTTKLHPFYASIEDVKDDMQIFFQEISNRVVARRIHENSIYAKEITTLEFQDEFSPPYAVVGYVRAKTRYDILLRAFMDFLKEDTQRIQLGDFGVGVDTNIWQDIKPILEEYKQEVKLWRDMLMGIKIRGFAKPQVGGLSSETNSDPYGLNPRW